MSTVNIEEKVYSITKDACQAMIDKTDVVCGSCGGKLSPIETIDNSGNPTFWSHCPVCQIYEWGTNPIVYEIAKDMVLNHYHTAYSHLGSNYGLQGEELIQWQRSQIKGTCSVVLQVLNIYKKLNDGK
jgi:hypothetical protein